MVKVFVMIYSDGHRGEKMGLSSRCVWVEAEVSEEKGWDGPAGKCTVGPSNVQSKGLRLTQAVVCLDQSTSVR